MKYSEFTKVAGAERALEFGITPDNYKEILRDCSYELLDCARDDLMLLSRMAKKPEVARVDWAGKWYDHLKFYAEAAGMDMRDFRDLLHIEDMELEAEMQDPQACREAWSYEDY